MCIYEPEVHSIKCFSFFPCFFFNKSFKLKVFFAVSDFEKIYVEETVYKDTVKVLEISYSNEFANLMRPNWYATFVPVWVAHHKSSTHGSKRGKGPTACSSAAAPGNLAHCRKATIAGMHIR